MDALRTQIDTEKAMQEQILRDFRHPNIITFYGMAFVREKGNEIMCLVTELCAGSLDIYIGSTKKKEMAIARGMPEMTQSLLMKVSSHPAAVISAGGAD